MFWLWKSWMLRLQAPLKFEGTEVGPELHDVVPNEDIVLRLLQSFSILYKTGRPGSSASGMVSGLHSIEQNITLTFSAGRYSGACRENW